MKYILHLRMKIGTVENINHRLSKFVISLSMWGNQVNQHGPFKSDGKTSRSNWVGFTALNELFHCAEVHFLYAWETPCILPFTPNWCLSCFQWWSPTGGGWKKQGCLPLHWFWRSLRFVINILGRPNKFGYHRKTSRRIISNLCNTWKLFILLNFL